MSSNQQVIPTSVLAVGKLMADLEIAYRGEKAAASFADQGRRELLEFTVKATEEEGVYRLSNSYANMICLQWLEDSIAEKRLPATFPAFSKESHSNDYFFTIHADNAETIQKVLQTEIDERTAEHKVLRHNELKAQFTENFEEICLGKKFFAQMGLEADLGARTPNGLQKEAAMAHAWGNIDKIEDKSPAYEFGASLYALMNSVDENQVLTKSERQEIFKASAERFIQVRKLGNTMAEIGEEISFVLRAPKFDA